MAIANGLFDGDFFPDKLVVYAYSIESAATDNADGLHAVAFFTEDFGISAILSIPPTEIIPESVHEYSTDGRQLVIRGNRYLPEDDKCCPSVAVSIALWVIDREVVVLGSEYR